MNYIFQAWLFLWGRDSLPFSIHCIENHNQERIFYNVKFLQWSPEPNLQKQNMNFVYIL